MTRPTAIYTCVFGIEQSSEIRGSSIKPEETGNGKSKMAASIFAIIIIIIYLFRTNKLNSSEVTNETGITIEQHKS